MIKLSLPRPVFFIRLTAAAASAYLLWAAFPRGLSDLSGSPSCVFFAMVPLLLLCRTLSPKTAAKWCFLSGLIFWVLTLSWVPAISKNGGPLPLVILGWFGLSAACAGYFALFGALDALLAKRAGFMPGWKRVLALSIAEPVLWAGLECLRARLFSGFAWNFLGVAISPELDFLRPLSMSAKIGGVYLVSALVLMINGILATVIERVMAPAFGRPADKHSFAIRFARLSETAIPLIILSSAVFIASKITTSGSEYTAVRVALIQRNFSCVFSDDKDSEDPLFVYERMLDSVSAAKPDLVVWSESSMAEFGVVRGSAARKVAAFVSRKTGGAALIAGGEDVIFAKDRRREYNSAALYVNSEGGDTFPQVYHKQHLVPFGEYIPFDKIITCLQRLAPTGVSLDAGAPSLFKWTPNGSAATINIAPLICFEDTDSRLACASAANGANVLVFITNDSWFSKSAETVQHYRQSLYRAIETGLPVLRVGNSGVTGVITPDGRVTLLADNDNMPLIDAPGSLVVTVAIPTPGVLGATSPATSNGRTPYTAARDWPLLCLFAATIIALLLPTGFRRFPLRGASASRP